MRRLLFIAIAAFLLIFTSITAYASDYTAPSAPDFAEKYIPEDTESFWEGLLHVFDVALNDFQPSIISAAGICIKIIAITMLLSLVQKFDSGQVVQQAGVLCIGSMLISPFNSFINLGVDTINQLHTYSQLLVPVMTGAMAAQGNISSATALYAGTTVFSAVLSNIIIRLLVPFLYILLALTIAENAIQSFSSIQLRKQLQGGTVWLLKMILYVFTGYMAITGVINGTTDAYALKATKLTVSGAVPVVGGIISDASEAILVSAGIMKNAAGIYGILTFIAICIGPFIRIGTQYLLLKATVTICSAFGNKAATNLVKDYSGIMGIVLATTGTVCLMSLISTICFMRGVT